MAVAPSTNQSCKFCQIVRKEIESCIVHEDDFSFAFLDHRPLFPGHTLLVPKIHYETLLDLPAERIGDFFINAQMLTRAVQEALHAEGSFVAINNKVSQSVPHLHVHIVPRRKGDGLKGFFWPRHKYTDTEEMIRVHDAIRSAIEKLRARK
jgi:histidine triad (HIT) family protein